MQQDKLMEIITQGRKSTIKTQLNHLLDFLGTDRKLDTITRERYKHYYLFRRRTHRNVKDITLLNERATIGHLYKWALEQGFINQNRLPVWSELKLVNVDSRTSFTIEDYKNLYNYLKNYTRNISDEIELYYRKLIRDFILIQSNTGLRFGEIRQLKWYCVSVIKGQNKYPNVQIRVPAEISKVKDRTAVGMRGDFSIELKHILSILTEDYVFADPKTGKLLDKRILYKMWHRIMEESGLKDSPNDYTYYCLRHTFATYRLQYGKIDIRTLAKIMGCSVTYIEKHYDNARVENMTDYITRGIQGKDAFGDVVLI